MERRSVSYVAGDGSATRPPPALRHDAVSDGRYGCLHHALIDFKRARAFFRGALFLYSTHGRGNYLVSIFYPIASKYILPCFLLCVSENASEHYCRVYLWEPQMSDVLQTATKYQSRLKSEMTRVNEFIQMAEDFMEKGEPSDSVVFLKTSPNSDSNSASQKEVTADVPRSAMHSK
jgi:hypothetical protein